MEKFMDKKKDFCFSFEICYATNMMCGGKKIKSNVINKTIKKNNIKSKTLKIEKNTKKKNSKNLKENINTKIKK